MPGPPWFRTASRRPGSAGAPAPVPDVHQKVVAEPERWVAMWPSLVLAGGSFQERATSRGGRGGGSEGAAAWLHPCGAAPILDVDRDSTDLHGAAKVNNATHLLWAVAGRDGALIK